MIPPYPLQWPEGLPRSTSKETSRMKTALSPALKNVQDSLRRFAEDSTRRVSDVVITSNVTLGADRPADVGVAVWFTWDDQQRCIAVDRYPSVQHNVQAIHHIIEARRTEMRHGGLNVVRQTFQGFTALPAPAGKRGWRDVLGFGPFRTVRKAEIEEAYRQLAAELHPDKPGGSHDAMAELNAAKQEALEAVSG